MLTAETKNSGFALVNGQLAIDNRQGLQLFGYST
jgi:hypothetical protein